MNKVYEISWVRMPKLIAKLFGGTGTLGDGAYLIAWPGVAGPLPIGLLLLGTLIGWLRFGSGYFFTESVLLIAFFILAGGLGAVLGLWFWLGYAIGDFVLFHPLTGLLSTNILSDLAFARVSALLQYGLGLALAVGIPVLTTLLCHRATRALNERYPKDKWIFCLKRGGIAALLLYLWTLSCPAFVIAIFRWAQVPPNTEAIVTVTRFRWLLVGEALVIGVLRAYLERAARAVPGARQRLIQYAELLSQSKTTAPARAPRFVSFLKAGVMTIMLAAMYTTWWQGLTLFLTIAILLIANEQGVFRTTWTDKIVLRRGPVQRLIVGSLLTYIVAFLSVWLVLRTHSAIGRLVFLLFASATSILVMSALLARPAPLESASSDGNHLEK
jgi:hypothetical protein